MWLSQREEKQTSGGACAEVGVVTLAGDPAGVYLAGERRNVPVFSPGGWSWRPAVGQEVLVLKTGAAGESPCIVGARCGNVEPGEVQLCAAKGRASIRLTEDGTVAITGERILVNGIPLLPETGGER